MPLAYKHDRMDAPQKKSFECELTCRPCGAPTPNGTCTRRVCMWLPYCWQHSRQLLGLRVQESRALPGATGLFAARDFYVGEMVAPYVGEHVSEQEIVRRYGNEEVSLAPYLLHTVDAACVRGIGSASNGAFGLIPKSSANVQFFPTGHRIHGVKLKGTVYHERRLTQDNLGVKTWSWAMRDIRNGEEILAFYGDAFGYTGAFERRQAECNRRSKSCDIVLRVRRAAPDTTSH